MTTPKSLIDPLPARTVDGNKAERGGPE